MRKIISFIIVVLAVVIIFMYRNEPVDLDRQIPAEVMASYFNGMQSMEDGIQYRIVRRGTGRTPGLFDKVMVNYRGFFKDGRVFDSSYKVKQPAIFQVNAVIPGWTKILMNMKEGGLWEVVIPARQAYGSSGAGNLIPPDTDLCFQIEFLKIY
ncbi:MAG: hypothetical protein Kow0029_21850 [Candidatus Rifleibacteriota bacterium]